MSMCNGPSAYNNKSFFMENDLSGWTERESGKHKIKSFTGCIRDQCECNFCAKFWIQNLSEAT